LVIAQSNLSAAKEAKLGGELREKDRQIAALNVEANQAVAGIATTNLKAAEANQRAEETKLELAKFKAPRTLTPAQQEKMIAALKPFAGQDFALAVFQDPESLALARMLDALLQSAGWKRVPSQIQREGGVMVEVEGETAATVSDSGVGIYRAPENTDLESAQAALCSVLLSGGISCERHQTPQLAGRSPRAVTISVGKKS
jgi:hypothetical protein